jgi:hypothetical protein
MPSSGFGPVIQDLGENVLVLQRQRNAADYDPGFTVTHSDAPAVIALARGTLANWRAAPAAKRQICLYLPRFPLR